MYSKAKDVTNLTAIRQRRLLYIFRIQTIKSFVCWRPLIHVLYRLIYVPLCLIYLLKILLDRDCYKSLNLF